LFTRMIGFSKELLRKMKVCPDWMCVDW
jgi:hypothetical protein